MNAVEVARFMFQNDGMRRVTGNRSDRRTSRLATVQRVLFPDAVNHEETREFLRRETQRISREFRERWNFDFETQTPLDGRYEWERVTAGSKAVHPAYELRQLSSSGAESRLSPEESNPAPSVSTTRTVCCTTASASSADKGPSEPQERDPVPTPTPVSPKTTPVAGSTGTPVQRKLTDFMTKRKRSAAAIKSADAPTPKSKVRKTTAT